MQREVTAALADVTQARLDEGTRGVDGCSIPAYAIPLRALAHGFARFATGRGLSPERAKAAARIRAAVAAHPAMVAGAGRFDTEAMTILGARAFTKTGAEGAYCAALPELGLGLAVKADDGGGRAAQVMIAALLRRFGALRRGAERQARAFRRAPAPQLERRRGRRAPSGRTAGGSRSLMVVWRSGRGRIMRLEAFAVLAVLVAAGAAHAADPCLNVGRRRSPI